MNHISLLVAILSVNLIILVMVFWTFLKLKARQGQAALSDSEKNDRIGKLRPYSKPSDKIKPKVNDDLRMWQIENDK